MSISYLSGGGASNLPVKLRYRVEPRAIMEIGDFDGFAFSNGAVKEGIERYGEEQKPEEQKSIKSRDLSLDRAGSVRAEIEGFPSIADPSQIMAELEFRDPNGEMQTASTRIPLWPAARLIGLQTDSWAQSKGALKVKGVVLDLNHHPIPNAQVKMDVFQRKSYSHRKRLVGGFYAYENFSETKRLSSLCEGKTDARGFIFCDKVVDASGEVLIQASTADEKGRTTVANISSWVPGEDEWWFEARDDDRIDVIPEKRNYRSECHSEKQRCS
jgi:hypothetical protein